MAVFLSLCVSDPTTECPSGTHTDTCRSAHTSCCIHKVSSEWSLQHHKRFGQFYFCQFLSSYSLFFIVQQCLLQHLLLLGCQGPRKKHADASIQCWSPYNTFKQASREDGPLWLLYCRETMLFDIWRVCCVAFHVTSMLFVTCLLIRCESATDWNPARV